MYEKPKTYGRIQNHFGSLSSTCNFFNQQLYFPSKEKSLYTVSCMKFYSLCRNCSVNIFYYCFVHSCCIHVHVSACINC